MPKTKTSITMADSLLGKLDVIARKENRSLSNLIETACKKYIRITNLGGNKK